MSDTRAAFKVLGIILALVCAIWLAITVGRAILPDRQSDVPPVVAIAVGVVCGVVAAVPTSVLLLLVFTRRDETRRRPDCTYRISPRVTTRKLPGERVVRLLVDKIKTGEER